MKIPFLVRYGYLGIDMVNFPFMGIDPSINTYYSHP